MGKRGPRPKPTRLRVIEGERRDRINFGSVEAPDRAPSVPRWLSPEARSVWHLLAGELRAKKLLTTFDRETFAVFCDQVALYRKVRAQLEADGLVIGGYRGDQRKHPAWQLLRDLTQTIRSYASEFGLTPSSRGTMRDPTLFGDADEELRRLLGAEGPHQ